MRRVIRLGDRTSHGGQVVTASTLSTVDGRGVARLGDKCTCPKKGHDNCVIVEGDPNSTIEGRPVALEGHKTSCGAVLLSSSPNSGRVYGSNEVDPIKQARQAHVERFQQAARERAERVADSGCITTDSPELKNKRLKDYWGTSDPVQIEQMARRILGIDTAQLPSMKKRRENWQKFVKRHIPVAKEFGFDEDDQHDDPRELGPTPGTGAYIHLEKYAMTGYGALMIHKVIQEYELLVKRGAIDEKTNLVNRKVLTKRQYEIFRVLIKDTHPNGKKAQAGGAANRINLPTNFPSSPTYRYGGQKIDPLAVLHHEFEHTRFGTDSGHDAGNIKEELVAVERLENPVRALSGLEPRYTYVQLDEDLNAVLTISIKNPANQKPGGRAHCMNDITKLTQAKEE